MFEWAYRVKRTSQNRTEKEHEFFLYSIEECPSEERTYISKKSFDNGRWVVKQGRRHKSLLSCPEWLSWDWPIFSVSQAATPSHCCLGTTSVGGRQVCSRWHPCSTLQKHECRDHSVKLLLSSCKVCNEARMKAKVVNDKMIQQRYMHEGSLCSDDK